MRRLLAVAVLACVLVSGCTDSYRSSWEALGSEHRITVWSGGVAVKVYMSTGKTHTEHDSDGWYFRDKATGKLVRVSGTVTIEQL